MKSLLLVALVVAVVGLALRQVLLRLGRRGGTPTWPFYAKRVLSAPEQVLYHRLVKALPQHLILAQVQLSRVLGVKKGFNFAAWNNRINRLSLDFLVCRKDASVVAAIELDDSSHNEARRREADARKSWALESAGVKLVRWSTNALPDDAAIRAAIEPQLKPQVLNVTVSLDGRMEPR